MDFALTPDQRLLAERTLEFCTKALNASTAQREPEHRFGAEEWRRCGEFGLLGLSVPTGHGGLGLDSLDTALAIEAFGKGCTDTGLVFSACAHLLACAMPIAEHGDEALKQRYLPRLATGELIAANAITEAEAGSDVYALRTSAVRDGDHYVLSGTKSFVTNAPVADVFLVYAMTDPAAGYLGISAFLVDRDTPGLRIGAPFAKTGLTTSPVAAVYLNDCRVPDSNRLGPEGAGRSIFARSMEWERSCLFAAYVGVMDRQLEHTIAHVTTRRQFRKPLARQQAVAHRIADMKLRLETCRLLLYRACWRRDQGEDATLDVSLAKLAISEAAVQGALDAVQLHGGSGVMQETGIEQQLRDAVAARIFSGTSEIHRDLIARSVGL
ncbi:acyl-CoA dehydrogenase family protein [Kitasatospora sp. NPDC049285]|uniref:acyl-CoA dehydrogenase family protein n=1 Tax=Kitasatospora sp. NPDC049285 TaxID=3157096 RepID=UPI003425E104